MEHESWRFSAIWRTKHTDSVIYDPTAETGTVMRELFFYLVFLLITCISKLTVIVRLKICLVEFVEIHNYNYNWESVFDSLLDTATCWKLELDTENP